MKIEVIQQAVLEHIPPYMEKDMSFYNLQMTCEVTADVCFRISIVTEWKFDDRVFACYVHSIRCGSYGLYGPWRTIYGKSPERALTKNISAMIGIQLGGYCFLLKLVGWWLLDIGIDIDKLQASSIGIIRRILYMPYTLITAENSESHHKLLGEP